MIPFFGAQAGGGSIVQLDDPSVFTDLAAADGTGGSAYSPSLLSGLLHANGGGSYEHLRRVIQRIPHDGAVTLTITPWRDGVPTGQTITRTFTSVDDPTATLPFDVSGSTFQLEITLASFDQVASLGSGSASLIVRRSQR